jgi:hypothetical protein
MDTVYSEGVTTGCAPPVRPPSRRPPDHMHSTPLDLRGFPPQRDAIIEPVFAMPS